ncbi:MAG TPA: LacI family DNA-binding transcriptional regulator [Halanaerobiales bacterium]|nr:LacI family DNA-binding transcriptional regulator [Halanaerobiales bacterium]
MKKITIKDVANKANVSPSTVSRVISDNPNISQDTKDKVRKIMKDLNYHPNAIARSLVNQKTNTLGLVMSRPTEMAFANPFFSEVIQGIAQSTKERHYHLMISAAENYKTEYEETIKLYKDGRVDGLILMASRVNDKLISSLKDINCPFVLIGRCPEFTDIPRVDNANIEAAYKMTDFLVKKGSNKIALISGPSDYIVSRDRIKGYKNALEDNGLSFSDELIEYAEFDYDSGYKATEKLLKNDLSKVDHIFALDDLLAVSAINCLIDNGYSIPEDIGVVGFNDQPIAKYINPKLTTVKVPIQEMGKKAAEMLIKIINDKSYHGEEIIIPTQIISRQTHRD